MHEKHKTLLAKIALVLLITGILIPIFARQNIAVGLFGIITFILALILGLISWQYLLGKIASISACIMITIFIVASITLSNSERKVQASKQAAEEAQSNANKTLKKAIAEMELLTNEGEQVEDKELIGDKDPN